jgi:small subunit ribosomal protein S3Ae
MGSKQKKEAKRAVRASVKSVKKKRLIKKNPLTKRKKVWYSLLAPQVFGKAKVGDSLVEESSQLVGKTMKLSLMTLTGDMKKQNITVGFQITGIADNQAQSKMMKYSIIPASIKRMVRRGRTRVDASVVCLCKDGVKLRIKPFVLTLNITNRSTSTKLRNHLITFLASYAAQHDYETMFKHVVSGKLQMILNYVARKVYPIRQSDIRVMEVMPEDAKVTGVAQKDLDVMKLIKAAESAPRPSFKRPPRGRFQRDQKKSFGGRGGKRR